MKSSELKDFSTDQLLVKITEEKQTLTKLRFAHAVSSVENPMRIHNTRKDIARLKTELQSRLILQKSSNVEEGASLNKK